ncbi:MAG: phosphatase PAP2 family protein [Myxococcota bacterium]
MTLWPLITALAVSFPTPLESALASAVRSPAQPADAAATPAPAAEDEPAGPPPGPLLEEPPGPDDGMTPSDEAAARAEAPPTKKVEITAPRPELGVPEPPPPVHPLSVRWGITAPMIATTGLAFVLMEGLGAAGPAPDACTPVEAGICPQLGALEPIDSIALGHYNDAAATASDVMVALSMAGPLAASLADSILWARRDRERGQANYRKRGAARFGIDTAIWAESIGVAMFTTNVLKEAVGRTRPLTHLGGPELVANGVEPDGDFGRSFPSGHSGLAFSSAVAGAMLLTLRQCEPQPGRRCAPRTRRQRVALGLMWGLGLAAASTTATLRVVAGKHYPTDVLMGAAIGTTSGIVIPLLHDRRRRH